MIEKADASVDGQGATMMARLHDLVSRLRLVARELPFAILSIHPQAITPKPFGAYEFTLRGVGFGSDQGEEGYRLKAMIGDIVIEDEQIERRPNEVRIHVDTSRISDVFSEFRKERLTIRLESTFDNKTHGSDVHVALLPKVAAKVRVVSRTSTTAATGPAKNHVVHLVTPNAHNQPAKPASTALQTADPGYKFTSARFLRCEQDPKYGNPCAFSRPVSCHIQSGGSQAICNGMHQSWPVVWYFEFVQQKIEKRMGPKVFEPVDGFTDLKTGETLPISFPSTADTAWVEVHTYTGQNEVVALKGFSPTNTRVTCNRGPDIGDNRTEALCTPNL